MIAALAMSIDSVTIRYDVTLDTALRLMDKKQVQEIVVVDDEMRFVGLLTPAGILRKLLKEKPGATATDTPDARPAAGRLLGNLPALSCMGVCEAMEKDVTKVGPETPSAEIAELLLNHEKGAGRAVVVDNRGVFLGIVAPFDIVRRLWEHRINEGRRGN